MSKQKKRIGRKAGRGNTLGSLLTPITEAIAISKGVDEDDLATVQARRKQEDRQERRRDERRQDKRRLQFLRDTKDLELEFEDQKIERGIERARRALEPAPEIPSAAQPAPTLFSPGPRVMDAPQPLAFEGVQMPTLSPVSETMESALPPSMRGLEATDYPGADIKKPEGQQNYINVEKENLRDIAKQQLTPEGHKEVQRRLKALSDIESGNLMTSQKAEAIKEYQNEVAKGNLRNEVIKTPTVEEELQTGQNIYLHPESGAFITKTKEGQLVVNNKAETARVQASNELEKEALRSQTAMNIQKEKTASEAVKDERERIESYFGSLSSFRKAIDSAVEDEARRYGLPSSAVLPPDLRSSLMKKHHDRLADEAIGSRYTAGEDEESTSEYVTAKELQLLNEYIKNAELDDVSPSLLNRMAQEMFGKPLPSSLLGFSNDPAEIELNNMELYNKFVDNTALDVNGENYANASSQALQTRLGMNLGSVLSDIEVQANDLVEKGIAKESDLVALKTQIDPFVVAQLKSIRANTATDGKSALQVYMEAYARNPRKHIGYFGPVLRTDLLEKGQYMTGNKEIDDQMIDSLPVGQFFVKTDGSLVQKRKAAKRPKEPEVRPPKMQRTFGSSDRGPLGDSTMDLGGASDRTPPTSSGSYFGAFD